MLSVDDIFAEAIAGVRAELSDAIRTATLLEPAKTGYDHATADRVIDLESRGTGAAIIETTKPIPDVFPDYTVGPGDQLALIHGFPRPKPGWILRLERDHTINAVQDILGAGAAFYVVMR